ncbi:MAG: hypothetical protein GX207_03700 [Peptococcaceae bacterium]|mgnify:CR=1 FL=1|nr:hypothetical protein [Peptococcaceae bacterium]
MDEFKSEYYTSWSDYQQNNEVQEDAADLIETNTQPYEEEVFDFTMWLVF